MQVTDIGVPVTELIDTVKASIKTANLSETDLGRDLRVGSITLTLEVVATSSAGVGVDFRVPFIGMEVRAGQRVSRRDTHTIQIKLTSPTSTGPELRDDGVQGALADAINVIRTVVARAASGDDPFTLLNSTVTITFAVTQEGEISIGAAGELSDEVIHTLELVLVDA
jgi:hypothetical protein